MILRTLIFLIFANTIVSNISFIDRIAIIVDEGIIMESELNEALENTVKNFEESGERLPPKEILFSRVTERLIMDEILLQKGEKFGIRISDQELNESLVRYAEDGANVILAAKTAEPHPKLPGTIYTAAEEIEEAGGKAFPVLCDVRFEDQLEEAVNKGADHFGGIDICVNNASAIQLTNTLQTDMKRYDLMNQINARGTFLTSKKCLPFLLKAENPHILNLSPPLDMNPKWFANSVAYSIAKFGMSLCVLGIEKEN